MVLSAKTIRGQPVKRAFGAVAAPAAITLGYVRPQSWNPESCGDLLSGKNTLLQITAL